MKYMVDNSSFFEHLSRKAFMSLQPEPYLDSSLLSSDQRKVKWLQRKFKKQQKLERRGKKIPSSPREALQQVNQNMLNLGPGEMRRASQCEGQLFKQRIRMDGCLSKVVINRFCHGTCMSYYIPRLKPRRLKLKAMFQSCSACQPSEYDTVEVRTKI
ncbi:unnamed protein product [Dracunculus medinensis]|uniref:DAN domain-containing protein n=1 Tax=Dracunculus medinensis TaxID=318479 RepID=A0A0N4UI15_DRAME|nr:unnamed protein product [Dracunculus medinensis]